MKFDDKDTHPSYGVIGWSRQHTVGGGDGPNLFGSDLKHGNLISLHIGRASRTRDLSKSWIFEDQRLIEVVMSASQFAEFITTPNMGSGVPCTIKRTESEIAIDYPSYETEADLHKKEVKETLKSAKNIGRNLIDRMKTMQGGKTIKKGDFAELMRGVEKMIQEVHDNVPFVEDSFRRSMQKTIVAGKVEIESYIESRIRQAGLTHLGADFQPPELVDMKPTKLKLGKKDDNTKA